MKLVIVTLDFSPKKISIANNAQIVKMKQG
jgi:hypothetical protein